MNAVSAVVVTAMAGRQRQNKNAQPGRLPAWREMGEFAPTAELAPTARLGVAKARPEEEAGAKDCAMAQALAE